MKTERSRDGVKSIEESIEAKMERETDKETERGGRPTEEEREFETETQESIDIEK